MNTEESVTDVRIEQLIAQTDKLSLVIEKVAEGMAALLATTAANDVKHNVAEEFKVEAKQIFRDVWKEVAAIKKSIADLQKPIIKNSLISNGVTGVGMLLIGVIAGKYFGA